MYKSTILAVVMAIFAKLSDATWVNACKDPNFNDCFLGGYTPELGKCISLNIAPTFDKALSSVDVRTVEGGDPASCTFWDASECRGASTVITGAQPTLGDWDNRISSAMC